MTNREKLSMNGYDDVIVFEGPNYDEALVAVTEDNRAVYDLHKMILCLEDEGMSMEEALDFISYNTIRALDYCDNPPVIIEAWIDEL